MTSLAPFAPVRRAVLVTVSGGVVHVDHVPPDVTVEVRDMDDNNTCFCYCKDSDGCDLCGGEGFAPTAYEVGPDLVPRPVQLRSDGRGTWSRVDRARPEFDEAPAEGGIQP